MSHTRSFVGGEYTPLLKKIITDWAEQSSEQDVSTVILKTTLETLLEAERDGFLTHAYGTTPEDGNKRNGYYSRLVKSLSGTFELRIPRDRAGLFEPLILEIAKQSQKKFDEAAYLLYTKGLSTRDVEEVVHQLYGASVSPQYISTITESYTEHRETWQKRPLDRTYVAVYIDAIHVNVRRGTVDNEAVYVALGLKEDFTREILGIYSIPQESASGWGEVLSDLRLRGVSQVLVFVADGLTGLEHTIACYFPRSRFQKCVVHLKRNVLKNVRHTDKAAVAADLQAIFNLEDSDDSPEQANQRVELFIEEWRQKYPRIGRHFDRSVREYFFTYLSFPFAVRRMVYTTNWIERLNKDIRKTTKNKNSFPNEKSVLNLVWATVMDREEKTYQYPITQFYAVATLLSDMLKR